jgi:hypothetical protein
MNEVGTLPLPVPAAAAAVEREAAPPLLGALVALAELPPNAILDQTALARALAVGERTIRNMVHRFELPPGVPLAGRKVWFAGRVLAHLEAAAAAAANEANGIASRLRRIG